MATDDSFRALIETAFPFPRAAQGVPGDDVIIETPPASVTGRADCCPATAAVRVVMPVRVARTNLLLCGHHFRASYATLAATGASVYDCTNRLIWSPQTGATATLWPTL